MKVTTYLTVALAALFAFTSTTYGQSQPRKALQNGRDLHVLLPVGQIQIQGKKAPFAVRFRRVGPKHRRYGGEAKALLQSKALAKFARDHIYLARKLKKPRRPIPFVLCDSKSGVSFCILQPYIIEVPGGKTVAEVGPVVYLSRSTIRYLRQSKKRGMITACHEMGHAITAEFITSRDIWKLYSPEYVISLMKGEGHWLSKKTDPVFAFSEGFAEYCGWYYTGTTRWGRAKRYLQGSTRDLHIREGAVAHILLALEKQSKIKNFHRKLLLTLVKRNCFTLNGLLYAMTVDHPGDAQALKKTLAAVTQKRFAINAKFGAREIYKYGQSNWQRLGKYGLSIFQQGLDRNTWKKWQNTSRELGKAAPYFLRELQRLAPQFQREVTSLIRKWIRRRLGF